MKTVSTNIIAALKKQDANLEDDYDLCAHEEDLWVDVTLRYDNTWGLLVNNTDAKKRFHSRRDAIEYLETAELKLTFA